MYEIQYTKKFKKELKLCQKRGYDINSFSKVAKILAELEHYQQNTNHTNFRESTTVVGSATYSLIGC